jgi:hypothetical protein
VLKALDKVDRVLPREKRILTGRLNVAAPTRLANFLMRERKWKEINKIGK